MKDIIKWDKAKQQRYRWWLHELETWGSQYGIDAKTVLKILQGNWRNLVYGWLESPEFIEELLYGGHLN